MITVTNNHFNVQWNISTILRIKYNELFSTAMHRISKKPFKDLKQKLYVLNNFAFFALCA